MLVHDIATDSALVALLAGVLGPRALVASIHGVVIGSRTYDEYGNEAHRLLGQDNEEVLPQPVHPLSVVVCTCSPYFRGDACLSSTKLTPKLWHVMLGNSATSIYRGVG